MELLALLPASAGTGAEVQAFQLTTVPCWWTMNCHGPWYLLAKKWLSWSYVMACSTIVFWYGLHYG